MSIQIDKDIPLPVSSAVVARTKYPWSSMEPGDSFAVPVDHRDDRKAVRDRLAQAASHYRKRQSKGGRDVAFSTRVMDDHVRVWRVR